MCWSVSHGGGACPVAPRPVVVISEIGSVFLVKIFEVLFVGTARKMATVGGSEGRSG